MTIVALLLALAPSAFAQTTTPDPVPRATRDVTAPGMTPGPAVDGPLVREAVPPPPPAPPRWRRFFLPVTLDSATFKADGMTIRVFGVAPPATADICNDRDGSAWPCGRTALFSLRMYLRGRAVECLFPTVTDAEQVIAPCRVGTTDLGLWLLTEGWAKPDENATDEYRKAADAARCARRGMWRGAPADGTCPAGEAG